MRFIFGIIVFWLSTLGYINLLNKKFNLRFELSLPLVFTGIGILMFFSGILNIMFESAILICVVGLIILVRQLIKKQIEFKFNTNYLIYFIVLLIITILCSRVHLLDYDNFSHWGLIVKNLFNNNALPNFENLVIEFKDYQPGSACFIYYFGFLTGKSEFNMLLGQNYLIISYILSLLALTTTKKQENILIKILTVSLLIFVMFCNVLYSSLMVDTLLSVILLFAFVLIYIYRDNIKKCFLMVLPISIYLFLVKNTGIVLVMFICLAFLYLGFKQKKFKEGFLYAFLMGIITILVFYIWSKHVSYVYGNSALSSKHALSANNILRELRYKGVSGILNFCKIYFNNFINVFRNIPNLYIISINLFLIVLSFIYKKQRKKILYFIFTIDIIYLLYYIILGIMYLLSMPWAEAQRLACFNRYMMTIVAFIVGLSSILLIDIITKQSAKFKNILIISSFSLLLILVTFLYNVKSIDDVIGNQHYKDSSAYQFDKILKSDNFQANNDDWYYIYCPKYLTGGSSSTYMYYLAKYKLNTHKIIIIRDLEEFSYDERDIGYNRKIITINKDNAINTYLKDNNYSEISKNIFLLNVD